MDINDLGLSKFSDLSVEEAHELIRQIRLDRRSVVVKPTKKSIAKKQPAPKISADQALELLKLLGGSND